MDIYLQNSLAGRKEKFVPLKDGIVSMYNCGPTVYDYAHVGNLRSYVFADTIRRMFEYNGYTVKQVINVTDIGHLSSDNDDGEDKMTKALKREGKPLNLSAMREIADFYFDKFKEDLTTLNIEAPEEFPFASDHIQEDIEIIQILIERGFAYTISDGIYFDTSKLSAYGKLGRIAESDVEHSRIGINPEKINSRDFALWKFNNNFGFETPFGKGFPGWHIECSAMARKYLGQPFDIHTGGIDHIPVHHNNEIAQSEAAFDEPLANFWLHNAHLNMGEEKMAKSGGNFITLKTLSEKGVSPLALRYVFLSARYSSPLQFSWEALEGAQNAWVKLRNAMRSFSGFAKPDDFKSLELRDEFSEKFNIFINDDLDTPKALALLWEVQKSEKLSDEDKEYLFLEFDRVLGLKLNTFETLEIPEQVKKLMDERELARSEKDFAKSDTLREKMESLGFEVKDTESGQVVKPHF